MIYILVMTTSNIVALTIKTEEEEEMPTISELKWNMTPTSGFPVLAWTVPDGYKLLIKKAGIFVHSVDHLEIARMDFRGDYSHSFSKFVEEINVELSAGEHVDVFVFNTSEFGGYEIGGWVMFDFIPV